MAHLRDGIPDGIIDRTLSDFSALDVRNRYAQGQRDTSRREYFVAVGDQKENVRTHASKQIRKGKHRNADALCHANVRIRAEQCFERCSNRNVVFLNLPSTEAELWRQ